jgi:hypothetical protein
MTPFVRLWKMYSADGTYEQAVGALFERLRDPRFKALVSFARLDPVPSQRETLDGRQFLVHRVLDGQPATRPDVSAVFSTHGAALAWLDEKRAELLAAGWWEGELDPISDPD